MKQGRLRSCYLDRYDVQNRRSALFEDPWFPESQATNRGSSERPAHDVGAGGRGECDAELRAAAPSCMERSGSGRRASAASLLRWHSRLVGYCSAARSRPGEVGVAVGKHQFGDDVEVDSVVFPVDLVPANEVVVLVDDRERGEAADQWHMLVLAVVNERLSVDVLFLGQESEYFERPTH